MNTHAVKTLENKSRVITRDFSQKKDSNKSAFQFVDNRPEAMVQRRLQDMVYNSPRAQNAVRLQAMTNQNPSFIQKKSDFEGQQRLQGKFETVQRQEEEELQMKSETAQRQAPEDEELMQGKFDTVQRQEEEELQMKSETAQRQAPEDEELMQGKFDTLQRKEEEELQMKSETAQRQAPEDEELMQGKFDTVQRQGPEEEELMQGKFSTGSNLIQLEEEKTQPENKTGMPDNLKTGIESLSGMDMSDVRVHYNSAKPAQLNALAYAQGTDIHLGSGQEQHLSHEAWHAVQQKQGRVKPTKQLAGEKINNDVGLEREADEMGAKALQNTGEIIQNYHDLASGIDLSNQLKLNIKQRKNTSNVLQKMAVMAVDDLNEQKDTLVWNNLEYATSQAGGEIGDLTKKKVWHQLNNNEEIRIVEHGEIGTVGGKSADYIANSMFTDPDKIPANTKIGGVTFQSCYAGVPGGTGTSLVGDMAVKLREHGQKGVNVVGRTGVAFGFEGMGEETASMDTTYTWNNSAAKPLFDSLVAPQSSHSSEAGFQAYFDAQYALRTEETQTTNKKIFKRLWAYNEPWIIVNKTEPEWKLLGPGERSTMVALQMEKYWEKLGDKMREYGGFKPPEEAIASARSKKCFLTTACTEVKGLPDDCEELTVLRQFRDNYLLKQPNGPALIELYYSYSPQIIAAMRRREDEEEILRRLYRIITECVDAIKKGNNEYAFKTYCNMVMKLKEELIPESTIPELSY